MLPQVASNRVPREQTQHVNALLQLAAVTDQYNNSLSNGFVSSTRNEQDIENIRMLKKLRNMKSQVNSFDLPFKYQ